LFIVDFAEHIEKYSLADKKPARQQPGDKLCHF